MVAPESGHQPARDRHAIYAGTQLPLNSKGAHAPAKQSAETAARLLDGVRRAGAASCGKAVRQSDSTVIVAPIVWAAPASSLTC